MINVGDEYMYVSPYGGLPDQRAIVTKTRQTKKGVVKVRLQYYNRNTIFSANPKLSKRRLWSDQEHIDRHWAKLGGMKP